MLIGKVLCGLTPNCLWVGGSVKWKGCLWESETTGSIQNAFLYRHSSSKAAEVAETMHHDVNKLHHTLPSMHHSQCCILGPTAL